MDILERFLKHDAWQTRKMIEHARTLTPDQYTKRFDIGPGSVHDTLLHIVDVMDGWAQRIDGRARTPGREGDGRVWPADELLNVLDEVARDLHSVARKIQESGRLDEMMNVVYEGTTYTFTRGTAITHVITHGMHHRAQVMNMLRQLGERYPLDGDAIEWEIEEGVWTIEGGSL